MPVSLVNFMCGIAGVIAWSDRFRITRETLAAMSACIAHRGPDAEGVWLNHEAEPTAERPQAGLVHRRLAVIDLDPHANQPFTDGRGRWVTFNGEIYNFRELRRELSHLKPDYAWRTDCDTEVLLVAYDAWGDQCVDHFNGMLAFAIWDERANTLYLARDRMGQKPLYFTLLGGEEGCEGLAFASELTALRQVPSFDHSIDPESLNLYLRWGYVPAPWTIYQAAEKLPPSHWMRIGPRSHIAEQYFDPNEPSPRKQNHESVVEQARNLVTQAVQRQLVADVPLGCFLSGGIDSSIIAAAMKAAVGQNQKVLSFSIGFDDKRYDETAFAAEVAKHLGTEHRNFVVQPDAVHDLPILARTMGEPFGDSSALPTHYLSRETRRHVTVALSGDGGDELFAGYDRYRAMWMAGAFDQMPERLKKIALSKIWQRLPAIHPKNPITRAKRLLASLDLPPGRRYDSFMRFFDDEQVEALLQHAPRAERGALASGSSDAGAWLPQEFSRISLSGRDLVEAALALDRATYLPHDLLFKVDASSMLHALEVRSPFMDHDLVHFAASLSTEQLLGQPPTATSFMQSPMTTPAKRVLKEAFARDLPASVFSRPKMGFAVPIGDWLRTSLREMLHDLLGAKESFASQHFNAGAVKDLLEQHEGRRADHSQRLYALLMLELWRQ
ncbi:MAG TPA: asparagine synthase (glutamine-hydrolyzing) [Tepidisphaeraceae bacterium]|jgi:asparagine synthase (glutamine-hydrolysing)